MRLILLLTAAYTNGNHFKPVGDSIPVGEGKHEITEERAIEMIDAKRAELVEIEDEVEEEIGDDLDTKTVDQLKAFAAESGIDLGSNTKRADIIAAIRAALP